ncbi:multicopper oxidase mco-like [Branchiostoma lanceolatum]|uniref:multicopper oxidase mco-like n=1 Tax=Branchiostoma lanceolatum TaxID=7740 RepID=UPI0034515309
MLAVLAVLLWNSDIVMSICSMTNPCKNFTVGNALVRPDEYNSGNETHLNVTLTVDVSDVTFDWLTFQRRLYNGKMPGPTLRVRPGDMLNIKLVNELGGNQEARPNNVPRHPNNTNLHVHGLHVSPMEPQDSPFVLVAPGESYQYRIEIPSDHARGTFWYHSHHHGAASFHLNGGLAGFLIVEDDPAVMSDELDAISCPNNCESDVPLLFGPWFVYAAYSPLLAFRSFAVLQDIWGDDARLPVYNVTENITLADWLMNPGNEIDYYLTNGQLQPTVTLKKREIKRFRMLSAGMWELLFITIEGSSCEMQILALDGLYVDRPYTVTKAVLGPGQRLDIAVKCSTEGSFKMKSAPSAEDLLSVGPESIPYTGILATIVVNDTINAIMDFPEELPSRPSYNADLRNLTDEQIQGRFVVEFGAGFEFNRQPYVSPTYYRYKDEVDTFQEWHILNNNALKVHPFHAHVHHFQVVSYNKYEGPYGHFDVFVGPPSMAYFDLQGKLCYHQYQGFDASAVRPDPFPLVLTHAWNESWTDEKSIYNPVGQWRDTILIPPLSNVTIRLQLHRYTGPVYVHCHNLFHSDHGMSGVVQIVGRGESTGGAHVAAGGIWPGTCRRSDVYSPNGAGGIPNHAGTPQLYVAHCGMLYLVWATALVMFLSL